MYELIQFPFNFIPDFYLLSNGKHWGVDTQVGLSPPQLLLGPTVDMTLFYLNERFSFLPSVVSTASLLSLLWPAVRLCVSSTSGEMQSHHSPSSLTCVHSHVSEFCGWLRTPVVGRTPTSIAFPCCAACLGCRSSTTKVGVLIWVLIPVLKNTYTTGVSFVCSCDRGRGCTGADGGWRGHRSAK